AALRQSEHPVPYRKRCAEAALPTRGSALRCQLDPTSLVATPCRSAVRCSLHGVLRIEPETPGVSVRPDRNDCFGSPARPARDDVSQLAACAALTLQPWLHRPARSAHETRSGCPP